MNYSRPIVTPRNKREGLENYLQMIINAIEAGKVDEALLKAVDLQQDISSSIYDSALGLSKEQHVEAVALKLADMEKASSAAMASEYLRGFSDGRKAVQNEIKKALGYE